MSGISVDRGEGAGSRYAQQFFCECHRIKVIRRAGRFGQPVGHCSRQNRCTFCLCHDFTHVSNGGTRPNPVVYRHIFAPLSGLVTQFLLGSRPFMLEGIPWQLSRL